MPMGGDNGLTRKKKGGQKSLSTCIAQRDHLRVHVDLQLAGEAGHGQVQGPGTFCSPEQRTRSLNRFAAQFQSPSITREFVKTGKHVSSSEKDDRNLACIKLIPQIDSPDEDITEKTHIPGYMGFTRGKKCVENLHARQKSQAVHAHMTDVSLHLNTAIHGHLDMSKPFPSESSSQAELVKDDLLYRTARKVARSGKVYNRSGGEIPGYGCFSHYLDASIRKKINLKSTGH